MKAIDVGKQIAMRRSGAFLKSGGHSLGLAGFDFEKQAKKASYSALQGMIVPANLRGCEVPRATRLAIM